MGIPLTAIFPCTDACHNSFFSFFPHWRMEYNILVCVCVCVCVCVYVFVDMFEKVYTGKLFCLAIRITLPSDRFAWRRAPQRLPLFKFAITGGPHVLCLCIVVYVKFLHIVNREGAENCFLLFADTRRI